MKPFRLCNLPELPLLVVLYEMIAADILKLAACSTKMESILKHLKVALVGYTVCVLDESTTIIKHEPECPTFNWIVPNGFTFSQEPMSGSRVFSMIRGEESPSVVQETDKKKNKCVTCKRREKLGANLSRVAQWPRKKLPESFSRRGTSREKTEEISVLCDRFHLGEGSNLIHVVDWMMKTLPAQTHFGWKLNLDVIKPKGLNFILNHPLFKSSNRMELSGGSISSKFMQTLLDQSSSFDFLKIDASIPKRFRHEDPFKAHVTEIRDARWVTIDNLLRLRGSQKVLLGKAYLCYGDIVSLIESWLENDYDMFDYLRVELHPFVYNLFEYFFLHLGALKSKNRCPTYFITPRSSTNKKKSLLSVTFIESDMIFRSLEDRLTTRERRIFKELHVKVDVEKEYLTVLDAIENTEKKIQESDSPGSEEHEAMIEELKVRNLERNKILRELDESVKKLEADGVKFCPFGQAITKIKLISDP